MSDKVEDALARIREDFPMSPAIANRCADTLRDEIASLRQQLEECKRDAERYRYLRDANGLYGIGGFKGFTKPRGHPERESEIDAAIDAARRMK